jgi:hypothetical protein
MAKPSDKPVRRRPALLERPIVSAADRAEWLRACRDLYDDLLTRTIAEALRPDEIARALRVVATPENVREFLGPLLRALHGDVIEFLKQDQTPLGDFVPEAARRSIDRLLERSDLIPDALVRKIFEQQAVQDAVYDTLYDGITQFNTTVNPFFADWGLPSFLRRMPFGGSAILASMEALRGEFERRLEPELRKFLAPFSRRATGQLADAILTKSSDPKFVLLRRNLVLFLYSQSVAELLSRVDGQAAGDVGIAVENVILELVKQDRLATMMREGAQRFVDEHGHKTVGQWLGEIGATGGGIVGPAADSVWPVVEKALESPFVRGIVRRVVEELPDRKTND